MSITSDPAIQINQLPSSLEMPKDLDEFREICSLLFMRIIDAVNKKEGSLYYLQEIGNFQSYFTANQPFVYRNVYRMVVNFGALPNATTKSVAHGIVGIDPTTGPSTFSFTLIDATSTNPTNGAEQFIPIPYIDTSGAVGSNVAIYVDQTNVNITTTADLRAFTTTYVVLEYLKN